MKHKLIKYTDIELNNERWRDIPEYEGIYQASDIGRIRTTEGKTTYSVRHGVRHWKSRILKPKGINSTTGYRVSLWKNKTHKDFLVARLITTTWIGSVSKDMTVNHKNGNRFDNRINNLEWLSLADNIRHGFYNGLYTTQIPITLINKNGEFLPFRSMAEASRFLGRNTGFISGVIKKGGTRAGDYIILSNKKALHAAI